MTDAEVIKKISDVFTSIANAIRAKSGKTGTIKPTDFATEISGLNKVYYLGTGTSFNVKSLLPNDWQTLTTSNFICCYSDVNSAGWTNQDAHPTSNGTYCGFTGMNHSISYSDGILTISGHASVIKGIGWFVYNGGDAGNRAMCEGGVSAIKVYAVVGQIKSV